MNNVDQMTKNPQILFLATEISGHGGIQRFNKNLIQGFKSSASQLKVASLNDNTADSYFGFSKNKVAFLWFAFKNVVFSKCNILVLGHLNFLSLATLKIFSPSTKVVVILHGIEAWEKRENVKKYGRFVDCFWSVSHFTDTIFAKLNAIPTTKREVIFNTIPDDWLQNDKEGPYLTFFLSVTRLSKNEGYKGIDKILEVLGEIRQTLLDTGFKYIIVASGNDLERHKELCKKLNLDAFVEFKTGITDDALKQLYSDCSFFVLPSKGEGFGIVFLEAMANKKACIGSRDCGTEDVIENNKTGFLIDAEKNEIKETILKLINNPNLCRELGENGFQKLNAEFTFERFQEKIKQLVLKCVE